MTESCSVVEIEQTDDYWSSCSDRELPLRMKVTLAETEEETDSVRAEVGNGDHSRRRCKSDRVLDQLAEGIGGRCQIDDDVVGQDHVWAVAIVEIADRDESNLKSVINGVIGHG